MKAIHKKCFSLGFLSHWLTWAGVAAFSLVLYLSIWPLFFHLVVLPRSLPDQKGVQVATFDRREIKGKPHSLFFSQQAKLRLEKPETSLLAYGLWKVSGEGTYRLQLECDDYGSLFLDGEERIRLRGTSARNSGVNQVEVKPGYHLLVLYLFNGPGQGWVTLSADDGRRDHSLLGGGVLTPVDLSHFNTWLRVMEGLKKVGWGGLLFASALMILLAFIRAGSFSEPRSFPEVLSSPPHRQEKAKAEGSGLLKKITVSFWAVLIILGFFFHVNLFQKLLQAFQSRSVPGATHPMTAIEAQLKEIKPYLPPGGTIGFISDNPDPTLLFRFQYALSPLLITAKPGPDLFIGLIPDPAFLRHPRFSNRFIIRRDFHNGWVLLESKK